VRLAVLLLATPVFLLLGLVGLTDGLIERDRRRFGGARETGFVYHHAKRLVAPSVAAAWVLYLAMPTSVHSSLVILPFAGLCRTARDLTPRLARLLCHRDLGDPG
jgi:integrating conjugative element membrane protein (TIGR03747 family)